MMPNSLNQECMPPCTLQQVLLALNIAEAILPATWIMIFRFLVVFNFGWNIRRILGSITLNDLVFDTITSNQVGKFDEIVSTPNRIFEVWNHVQGLILSIVYHSV